METGDKGPGWFQRRIVLLVEETSARAHERKYLRPTTQRAVISYEPADLFRLKTDALTRPARPGLRPRVKARDAFDAAFILERFPDSLTDARVLEIAELARDYRTGATKEVWRQAFKDDEIMHRADCENVWQALEQAIAKPLNQAHQRQNDREAMSRYRAGRVAPDTNRPEQRPRATPTPPKGAKHRPGRGIGD